MYIIVIRPIYAIGIALFVTFAAASAQDEEVEPQATVKGVQAYLEEFSAVTDSIDGRGRVIVSTSLSSDDSQREFKLIYERTNYETVERRTPLTHQIILYFFKLNDLTPSSVVVRELAGPISGRPYYVVFSRVGPQKKYIDYTNLFEQRRSDGTVDVTTSRGKAQTLALGYFTKEEEARRFADMFRDLLARAGDRKKVGPPESQTTA